MKTLTKQQKLSIPYQVKSNLAEYKEIDNSDRVVKAVVNTYNFFDYDYDVLRKGSAEKSIAERGDSTDAPDKILHALFHDLTQLPGKSHNEAETEINGNEVLYAETKLSETIDGEETLVKYNDGIYNQHSIGFRYMQIEYIEKESDGWDEFIKDLINPEDADLVGFGYDVKEINWHEWSTVAFGANKLTQTIKGKSVNKALQVQNIYKKMDAMIKASNRLDVKNKHIFNLQYKQLQQMIFELSMNEPDIKDTLDMEPPKITTQKTFNELLSNQKFF